MKNTELAALCGFSLAVPGDEAELTGIFCGDLLSWAMANVQEGHAWFTVMGNVNTVAVAALTECGCIVLCQGVQADAQAATRAREQGIPLYTTDLPEFEASLALAKALGL